MANLSVAPYPPAPDGMNVADPAWELPDTQAQYIQDGLVDRPGLNRRRGPVRADTTFDRLNRYGSHLALTLRPDGKPRYGILSGDDSNGYLSIWNDDGTPVWVDVDWPFALPTDPASGESTKYRHTESRVALKGGTWLSSSDRYDKFASEMALALWHGGDHATYSTGTITTTRGSASVTGSGTTWSTNVGPGMFVFGTTDDGDSALIGVVESVTSDTALTLTQVSPHVCTGTAYDIRSIRGFSRKVGTGLLTCTTASTTVNGGNTKFNIEGLGSGNWYLYRRRDMTYIGKVSSVTTDIQLELTGNAAIALSDEQYIALRGDGNWSIDLLTDENNVGFLTAPYALRQFYANGWPSIEHTYRLWYSDIDDPELVDTSDTGTWIPILSTGDVQEPIQGLGPAYNALLVMKDTETFALTGTSPATFDVKKLWDDGILSTGSIQLHGGGVIWAGREGIHYYDGVQVNNLTEANLGQVWRDSIKSFDQTRYRMWSSVVRNHYILHIEKLNPTIAVVKNTTSTTPDRWQVVINLTTGSLTMMTNVGMRGSVRLPGSETNQTWFLVNHALANPAQPTLAELPGGGSLSAGVQAYVITAIDSRGYQTGKSTETTLVVSDNAAVQVDWAATDGAASYRVYHGTTFGGENEYWETTATTFTDDGTSGAAGSPPTNNDTQYANICAGDTLFDDEGQDELVCTGDVWGPDFFFESKKFDEGDPLRLKRYKQLAIYYLAQNDGLLVDTVTGLNEIGEVVSGALPATVFTWSTLAASFATWSDLAAAYPTWSLVLDAVYLPKRLRFIKRTQHFSFRIYQNSKSVTRLRMGPFEIGFKWMRPGRV